jgi:AraC family transcriptional regulator
VTPLAVEGAALEILVAAARPVGRDALPRRPPAWLKRVVDLLQARFLDGLRLPEVAREAGVHPVHLTRVFRAHHGVSLGAYVRGLRLDWAATRLAGSRSTLGDIALEAGFADQSHFTRMFKRHTGSTPGQFRRRSGGSR